MPETLTGDWEDTRLNEGAERQQPCSADHPLAGVRMCIMLRKRALN